MCPAAPPFTYRTSCLQHSHLGRPSSSELAVIDGDVSGAVQIQTSFGGAEQAESSNQRYRTVVAIPAQNEVDRMPFYLAALAIQRTTAGDLLPGDSIEIVVFANN